MNFLGKYHDALGKPGQGFHAPRLFGFAATDLIGTIVIGILVSYFCGFSLIKVWCVEFSAALVAHIIFGVNTAFMNNVLGIKFEYPKDKKSE